MTRAVAVLAALVSAGVMTATAQESPPQAPSPGEQVFQMVCSACHSINPPHKAAPPMSHVTAYYLRKHGDTATAASAIVAWLKQPAADRSVMPAHVIQRFGLMPPQAHLSEAQLASVARYVLTLADTSHRGMSSGMPQGMPHTMPMRSDTGARSGMPPGMKHEMRSDSAGRMGMGAHRHGRPPARPPTPPPARSSGS